MKTTLSPKKCARIAAIGRSKKYVSKSATQEIKPAHHVVAFNFEIITPLMQEQERNTAYNFFSL